MVDKIAVRERAEIDPNVFQAFDRLDDDQIVKEMQGQILATYVYEFQEGGQTVRGLSKAGTDDAARHMAVKFGETIREVEIKLESQDEEAAYFTAKAVRVMVRDDGTSVELDSAIGQKRQAKFGYSRARHEKYPNTFWYEQGGQKAMRNAKQKLMPAPIKQALIQSYIDAGKVKRIGPADITEPVKAPQKPTQRPPAQQPSEQTGEPPFDNPSEQPASRYPAGFKPYAEIGPGRNGVVPTRTQIVARANIEEDACEKAGLSDIMQSAPSDDASDLDWYNYVMYLVWMQKQPKAEASQAQMI